MDRKLKPYGDLMDAFEAFSQAVIIDIHSARIVSEILLGDSIGDEQMLVLSVVNDLTDL